MIRFLVVLFGSLSLLALIAPFAYLVGYGLYHGRDVPNGIKSAILELIGSPLVAPDAEAIDAGLLTVSRMPVMWMGKLMSVDLAETSGLAASRTEPNALFAINDSGNRPVLYTLTLAGEVGHQWPIDYTNTHDFEDLAAFELEGKSYVLVADTGDNLYWRPSLEILVFESPEAVSAGTLIQPAWRISFTFADGYRDIEGVAVDEDSGSIFLVSKRHVPPEVFRLPLRPEAGLVIAEPVARLSGIPGPTESDLREDPEYGAYRSMPTAFDMNGRDAVVVTYKEAYVYRRGIGETWPSVFSKNPARVLLPDIYGLESVAFDPSGRSIYLTGEREDGYGPADVFRVQF